MTLQSNEADALTIATQEIAQKLGERDETPLRQIAMIVELAGVDFAREKAEEALRVDAEGGMMVHRGARRRTPGGIFFFLVKGALPNDVRQKIFPNIGQVERVRILEWAERQQTLNEYLENPAYQGSLSKNPITIIHGRPAEIIEMDHSVIIIMSHTPGPSPYPKGVPEPPGEPVRYILYTGFRHWQAVEIAIRNPNDYLIAEGNLYWDDALKVMSLFVQKLTTRDLEREAQQKATEAQSEPRKPEPRPAKKGKDGRDGKAGKQSSSRQNRVPTPVVPIVAVPALDLPPGIPPDIAAKLSQLHQAAETFRERIASMEARNQPGVDMTRKLLHNTERQIEALMDRYRA